ncbi:MAG TPA: hypothetical protein VGC76_09770 [Pyrinomonadaceae bacterium]|jgi:hypothetical protein
MKIISVILTFIGFVLCLFGNVGVQYFLRKTMQDILDEKGASGIAVLVNGFSNALNSSYVSIFGCVIIFFGIIFGIISIFTGRRQQQAI